MLRQSNTFRALVRFLRRRPRKLAEAHNLALSPSGPRPRVGPSAASMTEKAETTDGHPGRTELEERSFFARRGPQRSQLHEVVRESAGPVEPEEPQTVRGRPGAAGRA